MSTELTTVEQSNLQRCESIIESGLQTFVEVGQALMEVRDGKLYRGTHGTFAAYCEDRYGKGRQWAYQLISAAKVSENVSNCLQNEVPNEAQSRELSKLPSEQQAEVWEEVSSSEEPVTASKVKEAVEDKIAETGPPPRSDNEPPPRSDNEPPPKPSKPERDPFKEQRSKTIKTVEALMRAFGDLAELSSNACYGEMIDMCRKQLAAVREWKK